eukprot:CAMPEP_0197901232 /NCGR_PEP_ID=MMETSP1439-20131203/50895_1 /TAXON_ID=66791 /ORGANISM="Gonyaulax spinifera, Strain CCMP409" /LENGTH=258 /DNA_ID=CAMNT_0043522193 /DNA_START=76 /DNA_END=852 /DNA_ORIENTATION=+
MAWGGMTAYAPQFGHIVGHVVPGSLFVSVALWALWQTPWCTTPNPFFQGPVLPSLLACFGAFLTGWYYFMSPLESIEHRLHHATFIGCFALSTAVSACAERGWVLPGMVSVFWAHAFLVEAFLLMGHAAGALEKMGHDYIAKVSCCVAICVCWHLKNRSPCARVCCLFVFCLRGGIYIVVGLYLGLAFNGKWSTEDPHMLHKCGMLLHILIAWTSLLLLLIFVGRLSCTWAGSGKGQYQSTPCMPSAPAEGDHADVHA